MDSVKRATGAAAAERRADYVYEDGPTHTNAPRSGQAA
jgi:hypothetical protein